MAVWTISQGLTEKEYGILAHVWCKPDAKDERIIEDEIHHCLNFGLPRLTTKLLSDNLTNVFFTFSDYFVRTHPYFIFILPVILFLEPTFEYFAPGKSLMMVSRGKGTKNHADIYSTIHFVQSNSHFEFLYSTLQSRKPCVHPLHLFLKESWYPPVKIAYLKKW